MNNVYPHLFSLYSLMLRDEFEVMKIRRFLMETDADFLSKNGFIITLRKIGTSGLSFWDRRYIRLYEQE